MKKEIKEKWIESLLSGEYKQTTKPILKSGNKYCLEGVLADIYVKSHDNVYWKIDKLVGVDFESFWILPEVIKQEYDYRLLNFNWQLVIDILGVDHHLVKSLTRVVNKYPDKNGKMLEEIKGRYVETTSLNIIVMNHEGFSFEDISKIIQQIH